MSKRTALDEVLHSAQQMVNQQKFAYPPDWHREATEIIYQGEMELKQLRADLAAAVEALLAVDEATFKLGVYSPDEFHKAIMRIILDYNRNAYQRNKSRLEGGSK